VRKLFALIPVLFLPLTGCSGGGGATTTTPPPPPPPPSQVIATPGPPNVESLTVDAGPNALTTPAVNTAFISVRVCVPDGTFSNCQTIDHVEVDTGSIGLRVIASGPPGGLLSPTMLPAEQGVATLAECLQFADGSSWGTVNVADIELPVSGEKATNVQIEVIGAPAAGSPPAGCPGNPENTVPLFGANGILGVGPFINDCNSVGDCTPRNPPTSAGYFTCPTPTTCTTTTTHLASSGTHPYQVQNPIVQFASHADGTLDNNGVIVELPPVSTSGAVGPVSGSLVFGIGTQGNNAISGATKLLADSGSGVISARLNSSTYPNSYLDSGSNATFFSDASLSACGGANNGFYCTGGSPVSESATLQGTNGTMLTADFSVADASTLFMNKSLVAFSNLGGPNSDGTALDLGLSFFYGRNIFTGLEDPNVTPPYFAY